MGDYNLYIKVDTSGLDALAKDLDEVMFQIMAKGARTIAARAREYAPEDTGALKASIYVSNERGSSYNFAVSKASSLRQFNQPVNERIGASKGSIAVGAAAPYAMAVETGHITPGGGFYPARPFLEPAYNETLPEIDEDLRDAIESYGIG